MKFALRASEMLLRNVKCAARAKCAAAHEGKFHFTFRIAEYFMRHRRISYRQRRYFIHLFTCIHVDLCTAVGYIQSVRRYGDG